MTVFETKRNYTNETIYGGIHRGGHAFTYYEGGYYGPEQLLCCVAEELTRGLRLKECSVVTPPPGQASENDIWLIRRITELLAQDRDWMERNGDVRKVSIVALIMTLPQSLGLAKQLEWTERDRSSNLSIGCGRLIVPKDLGFVEPFDTDTWQRMRDTKSFIDFYACNIVAE